MKKVMVLFLVLSIVVVASVAFATIANTKHNLTTTGGFTKTTDPTATLCGFCHIAHGGSTAIANLPLWARAIVPGGFTLYGGGVTISGTTVNQPGTFSLTCLSCHDGTIGLGTITKNAVSTTFAMTTTLTGGLAPGGKLQSTNIESNGYSPYIGTDLRNDHPVGFTFPPAGYGTGNTPGISLVVADPTSAINRLEGLVGTYPLFNSANQFECATCHDPHLQNTGTTQTKFLRSANATFCQDCHDVK